MFEAQQGRDQEMISQHSLSEVVATWCQDVCLVIIFKPKPILGRKEVKIV